MRTIRLLVSLGLALAWLVLVPSWAYACSCAQSGVADHVERADVVVRGVVEDRQEARGGRVRSSADPVTYTVSVAETLKGETDASLDVMSVASGASCGLENIRLGEEYLVFASRDAHLGWGGTDERALWANLCGGTAPATPELVAAVTAATAGAGPGPSDRPSDVPTAAPAGQAGDTATPAPDGDPGRRTWPWLLGAVAALGAGAAGVVLRRRRG